MLEFPQWTLVVNAEELTVKMREHDSNQVN